MPVSSALVAAPVAAPGGDEEQAAEGDEEEPVLNPLDLAQGVYDNFEEPPAGIKMWHFACCDDNLQSSWGAAMCACCFMSWHVECVDDCSGGPFLGPKQCNFLKKKRKATDADFFQTFEWMCPRCRWMRKKVRAWDRLEVEKDKAEEKRKKGYWICPYKDCNFGPGKYPKEGEGGTGMRDLHVDRDHLNLKVSCPHCTKRFSCQGGVTKHVKLGRCKGTEAPAVAPAAAAGSANVVAGLAGARFGVATTEPLTVPGMAVATPMTRPQGI